ncbi:hypothetical protein WAF17_17055 [Bernardetia sp. ABR2-2B]|uniref:hypothetical protein n=1 Tax=Bernardetia sp. ABR2-2B TaxID=3127472 RepID=UPI0030CF0590
MLEKRNQVSDIVSMFTISFIPAFFLFLFNFTNTLCFKHSSVQTTNEKIIDILDNDTLSFKYDVKKKDYFWSISRIFSCTCFLSSVLLFSFFLTTDSSLDWKFILPFPFLIISVLLWRLPKTGSLIFTFFSVLVAVSIPCAFLIFIIYKPLINLNTNMEMLILFNFIIGLFGLSTLCISLAMLLLSKEAKEEWKTKVKLENQ